MKRIITIKQSEGGDDSKLFVKDLSQAFIKLANRLSWLITVKYEKPAEIGFFEIALEITGKNLENLIKNSGIISIQRVPPTERKGRVHTSAVTVSVTDPAVEINQKFEKISDDDFKVEWFSGTGCGGQHKNKHANSCRLTHIPTGIMESRQTRSRENSLNAAKEAILKRLKTETKNHYHGTISSIKKEQIGNTDGLGKTHTIRFQDNLVVDNKSGKRMAASDYMKGKMDLLW